MSIPKLRSDICHSLKVLGVPIAPHDLLTRAEKHLKLQAKPGKGYAGPMARALGLNYQRVYRWYQPGNGPDYEGAILLLEKCGWLNMSEAEQKNGATATPSADPLEQIAESVARIEQGVADLLEQRRDEGRPRAADPKPKSR